MTRIEQRCVFSAHSSNQIYKVFYFVYKIPRVIDLTLSTSANNKALKEKNRNGENKLYTERKQNILEMKKKKNMNLQFERSHQMPVRILLQITWDLVTQFQMRGKEEILKISDGEENKRSNTKVWESYETLSFIENQDMKKQREFFKIQRKNLEPRSYTHSPTVTHSSAKIKEFFCCKGLRRFITYRFYLK